LLKDHSSLSRYRFGYYVAYYNQKMNYVFGWEPKINGKEFTECGGLRAKARDKSIHKIFKFY
jgi:hypothetical protein